MPRAPAVCKTCGTIFASPFEIAAGVRNVQFVGPGEISPCPKCGGSGTIPNGVYSALNETSLAFTTGKVSAEDLERFLGLLKSARERDAAPEQVADSIKAEVPELSKVADALPKTRSELYAFLAVLIALVSVLLNTCQSDKSRSKLSETEVKNVVETTINIVYQQETSAARQRTSEQRR